MRRLPDTLREDGQALVEFALVLPLLLMVATAITSFGLMFYKYITIEDAVRSGARTLSLGRGADPQSMACDQAVQQTVRSAVDAGISASDVHPLVGSDPCQTAPSTDWLQGNQVTVSVDFHYSLNIFGVINLTNGTHTVSATDAIE